MSREIPLSDFFGFIITELVSPTDKDSLNPGEMGIYFTGPETGVFYLRNPNTGEVFSPNRVDAQTVSDVQAILADMSLNIVQNNLSLLRTINNVITGTKPGLIPKLVISAKESNYRLDATPAKSADSFSKVTNFTIKTTNPADNTDNSTVSFSDIPLYSTNDLKDLLTLQHGRITVTRNVGNKILVARDYATLVTSYGSINYIKVQMPSEMDVSKSIVLEGGFTQIAKPADFNTATDKQFFIDSATGVLYIAFAKATSKASIDTILINKTVLYGLTTPYTVTDISASGVLRAYANSTHIQYDITDADNFGIDVVAYIAATTASVIREDSLSSDRIWNAIHAIQNASQYNLLESAFGNFKQTKSTRMGNFNPLQLAIRLGKKLFKDEEFTSGYNSISLLGGANVSSSRTTDTSAPSKNKNVIIITSTTGATTPDLGGFQQSFVLATNNIAAHVFTAKLPIGFYFDVSQNSLDSDGQVYILGNAQGTGKYEVYTVIYENGSTTTPTVGKVTVKGTKDTVESLQWVMASAQVYEITNYEEEFLALSDVSATAGANKVLRLNGSGALPADITGSAAKLTTSRTFTFTGDVSGSANFDGSANVSITLSLPNTITSGTYRSVTVNNKGIITAGTNPTTIEQYGLTDAVSKTEASSYLNALRNLIWVGGGEMRWGIVANQFSWTKNFFIHSLNSKLVESGINIDKLTIAPGTATITNAWDCLYITVPSSGSASQTVTVSVAALSAVTGSDKIILAIRDEDSCLELVDSGFMSYGTTTLAGGQKDAYLLRSSFTAADDFLIGTGNGTYAKKTLAQTKTILGIPSSGVVGLTDSQTLTNKTLSGATFSGSMYLPNYYRRSLVMPTFTSSVANEKVKLTVPYANFAMSGEILITLVGQFTGSNNIGRLTKSFSILTTSGGVISYQQTAYVYSEGNISQSWAISDIAVSGSNYEITLSKLSASVDSAEMDVIIELNTANGALRSNMDNIVFGSVYTTDTSIPATPVLQTKGNTIWHAGNDGHNSTMDADTIDTYHASDLFKTPSGNAILLADATDINTILISGWYRGNNLTNSPYTGNVYLEVISYSATSVVQRVISSALINETSQRTYVSSSWGSWYKHIDNSSAQTISNKTLVAPKFNADGFIADDNGNELLMFSRVASATNFIRIYNSSTSNSPQIYADGSDANVGMLLKLKGYSKYLEIADDNSSIARFSGVVNVSGNYFVFQNSSGTNALSILAAGAGANVPLSIQAKGTSSLTLGSNGSTAFDISAESSSVNYIAVKGVSTGNVPYLEAAGSDANIHIDLRAKGTGSVRALCAGKVAAMFSATSTAVNYWSLVGSVAGTGVSMSPAGTDTNIDLLFNTKGSGLFKINNIEAVTVSATQSLSNKKFINSVSVMDGALKSVDAASIFKLTTSDGTNPSELTFGRYSKNYWIQSVEQNVGYTHIMLQPSGGNVGIGLTTAPTQKLEVAGSIKCSGDFYVTGTNLAILTGAGVAAGAFAKGISLGDSYSTAAAANEIRSSSSMPLYVHGTTTLNLRTAGADRLFISATGDVGIANTNPGKKLDVTGEIRASADITSTSGVIKANQWTIKQNTDGSLGFYFN